MNQERADMWDFAAEEKEFFTQLLLRLNGLVNTPELEDDELDHVNTADEVDMIHSLPIKKDDC